MDESLHEYDKRDTNEFNNKKYFFLVLFSHTNCCCYVCDLLLVRFSIPFRFFKQYLFKYFFDFDENYVMKKKN